MDIYTYFIKIPQIYENIKYSYRIWWQLDGLYLSFNITEMRKMVPVKVYKAIHCHPVRLEQQMQLCKY